MLGEDSPDGRLACRLICHVEAGEEIVIARSGSMRGARLSNALSAATGQLLWQRRLVTQFEQYIDIAPLIANNLVYLATVGYPPGGRGAIYALDAHNGSVRWKFSTIRGPWSHPNVAGGGGALSPGFAGAGAGADGFAMLARAAFSSPSWTSTGSPLETSV